ncbi:hypothetical protein MHBO_000378 [Bonamia ostreae]|uniref:HEAT repeat-containing protein 1 n=1 Tax=Bonamia ostreae TaxID=126728 RepID=A0ABV2AFE2_9EUKA
MTLLSKQLAHLSTDYKNSISDKNTKRKPIRTLTASFLFEPKVAREIDNTTIYKMGLEGLHELSDDFPAFLSFEKSIFLPQRFAIIRMLNFRYLNVSVNRSAKTKSELEQLDKTIRKFLKLLSPFFLKTSSHKCVEFLIRFFDANEHFPESLLLCALPFHTSSYFLRLVQILKFGHSRWDFLYGKSASSQEKQEMAPLKTDFLLRKATSDIFILKLICSDAVKTANLLGKTDKVDCSKFDFFEKMAFSVFSGNSSSAKSSKIRVFLPILISGVDSCHPKFRSSCFSVLLRISDSLSLRGDLQNDLLSPCFKRIDEDDETLFFVCAFFQKQKESIKIKQKELKKLLGKIPKILKKLKLKKESSNFVLSILSSLVNHADNGSENEHSEILAQSLKAIDFENVVTTQIAVKLITEKLFGKSNPFSKVLQLIFHSKNFVFDDFFDNEIFLQSPKKYIDKLKKDVKRSLMFGETDFFEKWVLRLKTDFGADMKVDGGFLQLSSQNFNKIEKHLESGKQPSIREKAKISNFVANFCKVLCGFYNGHNSDLQKIGKRRVWDKIITAFQIAIFLKKQNFVVRNNKINKNLTTFFDKNVFDFIVTSFFERFMDESAKPEILLKLVLNFFGEFRYFVDNSQIWIEGVLVACCNNKRMLKILIEYIEKEQSTFSLTTMPLIKNFASESLDGKTGEKGFFGLERISGKNRKVDKGVVTMIKALLPTFKKTDLPKILEILLKIFSNFRFSGDSEIEEMSNLLKNVFIAASKTGNQILITRVVTIAILRFSVKAIKIQNLVVNCFDHQNLISLCAKILLTKFLNLQQPLFNPSKNFAKNDFEISNFCKNFESVKAKNLLQISKTAENLLQIILELKKSESFNFELLKIALIIIKNGANENGDNVEVAIKSISETISITDFSTESILAKLPKLKNGIDELVISIQILNFLMSNFNKNGGLDQSETASKLLNFAVKIMEQISKKGKIAQIVKNLFDYETTMSLISDEKHQVLEKVICFYFRDYYFGGSEDKNILFFEKTFYKLNKQSKEKILKSLTKNVNFAKIFESIKIRQIVNINFLLKIARNSTKLLEIKNISKIKQHQKSTLNSEKTAFKILELTEKSIKNICAFTAKFSPKEIAHFFKLMTQLIQKIALKKQNRLLPILLKTVRRFIKYSSETQKINIENFDIEAVSKALNGNIENEREFVKILTVLCKTSNLDLSQKRKEDILRNTNYFLLTKEKSLNKNMSNCIKKLIPFGLNFIYSENLKIETKIVKSLAKSFLDFGDKNSIFSKLVQNFQLKELSSFFVEFEFLEFKNIENFGNKNLTLSSAKMLNLFKILPIQKLLLVSASILENSKIFSKCGDFGFETEKLLIAVCELIKIKNWDSDNKELEKKDKIGAMSALLKGLSNFSNIFSQRLFSKIFENCESNKTEMAVLEIEKIKNVLLSEKEFSEIMNFFPIDKNSEKSRKNVHFLRIYRRLIDCKCVIFDHFDLETFLKVLLKLADNNEDETSSQILQKNLVQNIVTREIQTSLSENDGESSEKESQFDKIKNVFSSAIKIIYKNLNVHQRTKIKILTFVLENFDYGNGPSSMLNNRFQTIIDLLETSKTVETNNRFDILKLVTICLKYFKTDLSEILKIYQNNFLKTENFLKAKNFSVKKRNSENIKTELNFIHVAILEGDVLNEKKISETAKFFKQILLFLFSVSNLEIDQIITIQNDLLTSFLNLKIDQILTCVLEKTNLKFVLKTAKEIFDETIAEKQLETNLLKLFSFVDMAVSSKSLNLECAKIISDLLFDAMDVHIDRNSSNEFTKQVHSLCTKMQLSHCFTTFCLRLTEKQMISQYEKLKNWVEDVKTVEMGQISLPIKNRKNENSFEVKRRKFEFFLSVSKNLIESIDSLFLPLLRYSMSTCGLCLKFVTSENPPKNKNFVEESKAAIKKIKVANQKMAMAKPTNSYFLVENLLKLLQLSVDQVRKSRSIAEFSETEFEHIETDICKLMETEYKNSKFGFPQFSREFANFVKKLSVVVPGDEKKSLLVRSLLFYTHNRFAKVRMCAVLALKNLIIALKGALPNISVVISAVSEVILIVNVVFKISSFIWAILMVKSVWKMIMKW